MTDILSIDLPFTETPQSQNFDIIFTNTEGLTAYLTRDVKDKSEKKNRKLAKAQFDVSGFTGKKNTGAIAYKDDGSIYKIFWGVKNAKLTDGATLGDFIAQGFSSETLENASFSFEILEKFKDIDLTHFCIGWGLSGYKFDAYKKNSYQPPILALPSSVDQNTVESEVQATTILRDLVNTPANDLGTDELAAIAKQIAKTHKAKIKIIKDEDLNKKGFPMIYTVGKASPRRPQLVDMKWGKATDPKVTIVGKGIIYDTGGLNLKTGVGMRNMKKDMGGAAHALGVAWMIMAMKLPVQLRVLLPLAENSVAGNAFRPGDVFPTRKGITVEIDDTDAEGRLVLSDSLTYACEENPDLLIDFATLTGSARVAIGYDIPAFFSNRDEFLDTLRHSSKEIDDFVWPFPLWEGYDNNINGDISDIISVGSGRAGHIEAALFLQRFITDETDWIHMDCFAWEQNGKAGRPKGGADTGMRAIFNFIKQKYS